MSRWLIEATMNSDIYRLVEKYKDIDSYDIPEDDKAIIMSNPLACAQYAIYYEQRNSNILPYEWYDLIRKDVKAIDWYLSNNGLYDLEVTKPANQLLD